MVRLIKRGILGMVAVGLLVVATGGVPAYADSPWWHLTSGARPTDLQPGKAKSEVQEIKVSATGGDVFVPEPVSLEEVLNGKKELGELKDAEFAYDATHEEAQAALEGLYGAGNVAVSGGPGDAGGSKPYVVTFKTGLNEGVMNTEYSVFLGGLEGTATVTETSKGEPDGYVVVRAADLGDANVEARSPVSISDKLPRGVRPVHIEAVTGEASFVQEVGSTECSLATLSCSFTGFLPDYDSIEVVMAVVLEAGVETGALNEAQISGGGVLGTSVKRPLTVGNSPTQFGVQSYEMDAEEVGGALDTQAGSHPFQLTTTLAFNETEVGKPASLVKDLHFKLPPGLVGNPTPIPVCTLAQFYANGGPQCPVQTVIGVARVTVLYKGHVLTIANALYNLEPATGEPARFGFFAVFFPVILDTSVRTGEDYGVTVNVPNITQTEAYLGSEVTFWGVPGDEHHEVARGSACLEHVRNRNSEKDECKSLGEHFPSPLLTLPTSCTGPLTSTVEADSWLREEDFQVAGTIEPMQALDGCNRLQFEPSIVVAPDGRAGSTPTGLTVGVHLPQSVSLDAEGLAEADVRNTTVTLPEGVVLNPAAADGLSSCSLGQIGLENDSQALCPEASKVGTVRVKSPLLANALVGSVYLAAQDANPFGSLVALYVVASDPVSGTLVKLAGEVALNQQTGQLVSTFRNTPQVPVEDFELHFFGGDRAPLATPGLCGAYTTSASIEPWTGGGPVDSTSTFDVNSGPNGSSCSDPLGFAPSLTGGTTSIQAGGFSPFTTTFSRTDGQQDLKAVRLHMPSGLLGLVSSVTPCEESRADAGTCGPESLIGHTTVSVGVGGDPYSVTGGEVFLTGPYEGAPYGLSIVVSAKAGPYDLGRVVVRAKIEVDPLTANLTVTTDPTGPYSIPDILDGIPLQIQHVNVSIDRPGFIFNPTSCEKLEMTGSLTSDQGATSNLNVPFQVTNCATLGFKPKLTASTSGKTSRRDGTSLALKIAYPKGAMGSEAWFKSAKFDFPKQLPSRLTTLQRACPAAKFNANPASCPSESHAGTALVNTPVLPGKLAGTVYFVSYGDAKFPEAVIVLQGDDVTVDLHAETFIDSKTGVTSATLRSIPGVPFSSVEVDLPAGPYSEFAANGNLCTSALKMPIAFTAQNGLAVHQNTRVNVTGCPKHKQAKKKTKKTGKDHKASTHGKKR